MAKRTHTHTPKRRALDAHSHCDGALWVRWARWRKTKCDSINVKRYKNKGIQRASVTIDIWTQKKIRQPSQKCHFVIQNGCILLGHRFLRFGYFSWLLWKCMYSPMAIYSIRKRKCHCTEIDLDLHCRWLHGTHHFFFFSQLNQYYSKTFQIILLILLFIRFILFVYY